MSTSTAPAPRARTPHRRRNIALITVVVVILALAGVAVGGEFYARHRIGSCISSALQDELGGGDVDVSLGSTPILFTAFTHSVSSLTIDSPDADLSGPGQPPVSGLSLSATIHDIDLPRDGSSGSVGSSQAHVQWSTDAMAKSLQRLAFGGLITGVEADESAGTLDVKVLGGIGTITLTPVVSGGAVTMDASDVTAFGIGLPTSGVQDIIDTLTQGVSDYPLGMVPQAVHVTSSGLQVELAGGHAPLNEPGMPQVHCSVF